jgi:hypothetical protein
LRGHSAGTSDEPSEDGILEQLAAIDHRGTSKIVCLAAAAPMLVFIVRNAGGGAPVTRS